MSNIRLYLVDASGQGLFRNKTEFLSSGVPRLGDTVNLFEIMPKDSSEDTWYYEVELVEWSMEDGKLFEPVIHVTPKK